MRVVDAAACASADGSKKGLSDGGALGTWFRGPVMEKENSSSLVTVLTNTSTEATDGAFSAAVVEGGFRNGLPLLLLIRCRSVSNPPIYRCI